MTLVTIVTAPESNTFSVTLPRAIRLLQHRQGLSVNRDKLWQAVSKRKPVPWKPYAPSLP